MRGSIVMIFDERAVTVAFDGIVRRDQSNAHMLKDILFRHCGDAVARCGHARVVPEDAKNVQQFDLIG